MEVIEAKLTSKLLEEVEKLIKGGLYADRDEAIRERNGDFMVNEQREETQSKAAGAKVERNENKMAEVQGNFTCYIWTSTRRNRLLWSI